MALGRDWEPMAHQEVSSELQEHDLWEEREAALHRMGETAMMLHSVLEAFNQAQTDGHIPPDLWNLNTRAQVENIAATGWLMEVNRKIHQAGL